MREITFEIAKLAKAKGFNEFYFGYYYDKDGNEWMGYSSNLNDYKDKYIKCSQSCLQTWLRNKHKICVIVELKGNFFKQKYYCRIVKDFQFNKTIYTTFFNSYEDALEEGLKQALILIN